jgi:large subunit ribosomal protein L5
VAEVKKEKKKPATGGKRKGGASFSQVQIAEAGQTRASPEGTPRLLEKYRTDIVPQLVKNLGLKNLSQVPKVTKIVLNCAVKEAVSNPKVLDSAFDEMMAITGQRPVMTRARKSIASFKVRAGIPLGVKVTLRRARMYEFLDRLVNVALPRVRDFKGVATRFDSRGNFSLGLKEQIIFPEINYDKVEHIRGLTVTIATSAETDEHARALLDAFGMPFRK